MAAISLLVGGGCRRKAPGAAWWESEQERIDLVQQLALKEFRLSKREISGVDELEEFRRQSMELKDARMSLTRQRDQLEKEIESLDAQWLAFQDSQLREHREQALSRTFEQLDTVNGRRYYQVSVTAVEVAGVTIRHADGSARLRFEDLSVYQRLIFGLDQASAEAAVEEETADIAAYDHWIDDRLLAMREEKEAQQRLAAAAIQEAQDHTTFAATQANVTVNVSPLARTSRGDTYRSSRYRVYWSHYRPTYYYYQAPMRCTPGVTYLNRPAQLGNRCNSYNPQGFRP